MNSEFDVTETNPLKEDGEILGMKTHTFCMALHLSQLLSFAIPLSGVVAPIVLWIMGKDKSTMVNQQGKIVINWIISSFIYLVVSGILCLVFIGFLLVPIVVILNIIFVIFGAIKASEGITWRYPLSIPFFS